MNESKDVMSEKTVSEKTPMSIGLVAALIILIVAVLGCVAAIGGSVWTAGKWIGEFQTKLDTIILDIKIVKDTNTELRLKWDNHEARLLKLETMGSPNVQKLQDQLSQLQRSMDLHTAQERKP